MDTRIGYPNEHLAGDSDSEATSPMYATAVGLVLNRLQVKARFSQAKPFKEMEASKMTNDEGAEQEEKEIEEAPKERKRFFDKWAEKFKEFLDNAE
jgi:cell division protein FtsA